MKDQDSHQQNRSASASETRGSEVTLADVYAARERIAAEIRETPCTRSATLSAMTGADVWLKFENLHFTSSFKERGALNALLLLPPELKAKGVVAMSAGNHAQAIAYHGQRLGLPTTIVMPLSTPNAKVEATRVFGAEILLRGDDFDQARLFTETLARERGLTLVHPFDDPDVIAGQGTLGLELADQLAQFDDLIVPVGGGGLLGGTALVLRQLRPELRITGVQMERYSAAVQAFTGCPSPAIPGNTVAEGIAVKQPGRRTLPLLQANVNAMVCVTEAEVEQAVFTLLEIEKTVTEGAGAAGLAALMADPDRYRGKSVVIVLTGGNVDMMILSSILQRGLVRSHRLAQLQVEIPDLPGALGQLTQAIGDLGGNIVELEHHRAFASSSVRATQIELSLQLRGEAELQALLDALNNMGYEAQSILVKGEGENDASHTAKS